MILGYQATIAIADELVVERRRQVDEEGHVDELDDGLIDGTLERSAAAYAFGAATPPQWAAWLSSVHRPKRDPAGHHILDGLRLLWPFDLDKFRSAGVRRMLVKAGALVIAAIERLDRAEARKMTGI